MRTRSTVGMGGEAPMKALLTWVGLSDPDSPDEQNGRVTGPILTLLEELPFDLIYLFHQATPAMNRRASHVAAKARELCPGVSDAAHVALDVADPTDYYSLLRAMRSEVDLILRRHHAEDVEYAIQMHSGTPQMQWVWLTLAQNRVIEATLYGLHPRYMPQFQPPYRYTIDLADVGINASPEMEQLREEVTSLEEEARRLQTENAHLRLEEQSVSGAMTLEQLPDGFRLLDYLKTEKARLIAEALSKFPDNAAEAARAVGMNQPAFRRAAADLGLRPRQRK